MSKHQPKNVTEVINTNLAYHLEDMHVSEAVAYLQSLLVVHGQDLQIKTTSGDTLVVTKTRPETPEEVAQRLEKDDPWKGLAAFVREAQHPVPFFDEAKYLVKSGPLDRIDFLCEGLIFVTLRKARHGYFEIECRGPMNLACSIADRDQYIKWMKTIFPSIEGDRSHIWMSENDAVMLKLMALPPHE